MGRLYGTQRYMLEEINAGLADGVREFLFLKGGRQVGGSTLLDALTLYHLQAHAGLVGQLVSDDEGNIKYRRKLLRQMLDSLPKAYRWPVNADNRDFLEWGAPNGSTLLFDFAGIKQDSNLGRSKGLNYLYADEVGSWPDQRAVGALKAALSEHHRHRLYCWVSTARGFNVFADMWKEAATAVSTRRSFVAWWRHKGYRVPDGDPRFAKYAGRVTTDERRWIREIRKRYAVEIEIEQLVWHRWKLAEGFLGDETLMAQEFGCLPEDCFQAFGDKFIPPAIIRKLHMEIKDQPLPKGTSFTWGQNFDETEVREADPLKAQLRIYTEPDKQGTYIVAGHPWGSSSPAATQWVAEVFRAWPDRLEQVAEYTCETGTTYEFAWLLIYLGGAYNGLLNAWLIVEESGPGLAVLNQIELFQTRGYGLSVRARLARMNDFVGTFNRYFYFRPDNVTRRRAPIDWKTDPHVRPYLLHSLADTVIPGRLEVKSATLVDSMAALRRGEFGNNDHIAGRAGTSDAHAICAALAVKCWQDFAMPDLELYVPPKAPVAAAPQSTGELLVAGFLHRLQTTGRAR